MKINCPEDVENIIHTLSDAGYEAYAVGGCVRDSVLGRVPGDWDITTSASPMQVKGLFRHTVDTGLQHGTVTVMLNHVGYEVTTYRIDGVYEDSRHPKQVTFTSNLEEDLRRRDFTINAMAYSDVSGMVDEFEGLKDLERKIIRCVGEPNERFSEDALRMLRAVRFAAQLGFEIDEETQKAIKKLAPTLSKVSAERIQAELLKIILSPNPDYLRVAYQLGMTAVFMPEFDVTMETEQDNPHHCYTVGEHILHTMKNVLPSRYLRLSAFFHDFEKPSTKKFGEDGRAHFYGHAEAGADTAVKIMRRLKFDNETVRIVSKMVLYHDYRIEPGVKYMRRAMQKVGEELFPMLFDLQEADIHAQSMYKREQKESVLRVNREDYQAVIDAGQCTSLKDLAISGTDLIEAGLKPGKEIGEMLQIMLKEVIDNPEHNTKEFLMTITVNMQK